MPHSTLAAAPEAARAAPGGWEARLDLTFERDDARTVLATRKHVGPLRVQKALYPEGPEVCQAIIVHPPGGIVGGDSLSYPVISTVVVAVSRTSTSMSPEPRSNATSKPSGVS